MLVSLLGCIKFHRPRICAMSNLSSLGRYLGFWRARKIWTLWHYWQLMLGGIVFDFSELLKFVLLIDLSDTIVFVVEIVLGWRKKLRKMIISSIWSQSLWTFEQTRIRASIFVNDSGSANKHSHILLVRFVNHEHRLWLKFILIERHVSSLLTMTPLWHGKQSLG